MSIRRRVRVASLVLAAVGLALVASVAPVDPTSWRPASPGPRTPTVAAAPGTDREVVALVVEGVGNGHGRGMSQWGAYGRAIAGQTWQQILDTYYGGTTTATATNADHHPASPGRITVRLVSLDGLATTGVVSRTGAARWTGGGNASYHSLHAQHVSGSTYRVFGSTALTCPGTTALVVPDGPVLLGARGEAVRQIQQFLANFGFDPGPVDGIFGNMTAAAIQRFQRDAGLADTGTWHTAEANEARRRIAAAGSSSSWQDLGTTTGPVRFTTTVSAASGAPGDVLGVCQRDGSIVHYRGDVLATRDAAGALRTVNDVPVDAYLRGVVPREVSASWGDAAGGAGMHALRAQAVAARSYALSQNRYSFAKTCDTTACQAYGGAGIRSAPTGGLTVREHANTDRAVADTSGVIRRRSGGQVASTEYSASNGPRTAGGTYPAVDDPFDDQRGNPNHRWTRVISASSVASRYGTGPLTLATTESDPALVNQGFQGIWSNRVRLSGTSTRTVSAWDFRGAYGLPSPGFTIRAVTRDLVSPQGFALVGDSISAGVTGSSTAPLPSLLSGVFRSTRFDAVSGRTTTGAVGPIGSIPLGTDLVVVQLGYNDPANYAGKVDQVMQALRGREVGRVLWVNLSERRTDRGHAAVNSALRSATSRWPELQVLDWNAASSGASRDRWFSSDQIHLTVSGRAEFSRFVREGVLSAAGGVSRPPSSPAPPTSQPSPGDGRVSPDRVLRVPVAGVAGAPSGASGVVLNVTGTDASRDGFVTVWPCGSPRPLASSLNVASGRVAANEVIARVDGTGEVCMYASQATHLVVDVTGWFTGGFVARERPERLVDTRER